MLSKINLGSWGPVTVVLTALVVIVVIGGIVCAAIGDAALHRFIAIASQFWKYAAALAGLGIGRGIHLGLTNAASSVGDSLAFGSSGSVPGSHQGIKSQSFYEEAREPQSSDVTPQVGGLPQIEPGDGA